MRKIDIQPRDVALSLVLLTRLPLPHLPKAAFARQAQAAWAFPLAGLAVALPACGLAWVLLALGLPAQVAAGGFLGVQILLTGAMHEDGLADSADGLWGGFDKDRRLEIMKDSRIGAYGVIALILCLGLRWSLYAALLATGQLWSLLALAMLSRAVMPGLMATLPNARGSGLSAQVGRPNRAPAVLGATLALVAGLALIGAPIWIMGATAALTALAVARIAKAKIGGQTGDILGASQQLAEITCAMALLAQL